MNKNAANDNVWNIERFFRSDLGINLNDIIETIGDDHGICVENVFNYIKYAGDLNNTLSAMEDLEIALESMRLHVREMIEALLDHEGSRERVANVVDDLATASSEAETKRALEKLGSDAENAAFSDRPLPDELRKQLLTLGMPEVSGRRKVKTFRQALWAMAPLSQRALAQQRSAKR